MDEATANIDVKTEETIQTLIQEEFKNSTVITIAHRLNTIIHSDRVLVLEMGEIVEYSDPQTLMSDPFSSFSELLAELDKQK